MCSNRAANSSSSRTIFVFFFSSCRLNRGGGGGIVVVIFIIIAFFFFFSSLKSSSSLSSSSSSFGGDRKDISLKTIIFYRKRESGVFVCTSSFLFLFSPTIDEKFVRWPISLPWTRSWLMRGPSSLMSGPSSQSGCTRGKIFSPAKNASRRRKKIFSRKPPLRLSLFPHTFSSVFVA